jgi:hypothetical protein
MQRLKALQALLSRHFTAHLGMPGSIPQRQRSTQKPDQCRRARTAGPGCPQPAGQSSSAAYRTAGTCAREQRRSSQGVTRPACERGAPAGFVTPAIYARYGTGAYHDVGTGQHVPGDPFGPGTTPAVVIPVGLGVPPPLLVTQSMDVGPTATPGHDRRNPSPATLPPAAARPDNAPPRACLAAI